MTTATRETRKPLRIVFSDCIPHEFRKRKSDTEFPVSLESLDYALKDIDNVVMDYAFLPPGESWGRKKLKTIGINGQKPFSVSATDILAVNMMNHLQLPYLFQLLQEAGIPISNQARTRPLVIIGGPVWTNPLPLKAFADCVVLGDGEDTLRKLVILFKDMPAAATQSLALKEIAGLTSHVYVPSFPRPGLCPDSIDFSKPEYLAASRHLVNNTGALVLARGCPHQCSFCQARCSSGTYRARPFAQLEAGIGELKKRGARKIMLLATTASSYRDGTRTIDDLVAAVRKQGMIIRSMSERMDAYKPSTLHDLVQDKHKVNIAPEASPRIRNTLLRKNLPETVLKKSIHRILAFSGVRHIQLYAIVAVPDIPAEILPWLPEGFPGENRGDLLYLLRLAGGIADILLQKKSGLDDSQPLVNIDCMPLVPAPGSQLAAIPFPSYARYLESLAFLKDNIPAGRSEVIRITRGMDEKTYLLQGLLERGGHRESDIVRAAFEEEKQAGFSAENLKKHMRDAGIESQMIFDCIRGVAHYRSLFEGGVYGPSC